jgi:hypothetical protein
VAHSEIPFWHLPGRTKEYYPKVKIIGITAEIRIGNLANTNVVVQYPFLFHIFLLLPLSFFSILSTSQLIFLFSLLQFSLPSYIFLFLPFSHRLFLLFVIRLISLSSHFLSLTSSSFIFSVTPFCPYLHRV